mmetsp:Transcript_16414/g.27806  ORF Transcript_16414/g.27806 Transcript_16414/m.27806 type:complete len:93 (-) Transcript_16414:1682-1960(-)
MTYFPTERSFRSCGCLDSEGNSPDPARTHTELIQNLYHSQMDKEKFLSASVELIRQQGQSSSSSSPVTNPLAPGDLVNPIIEEYKLALQNID